MSWLSALIGGISSLFGGGMQTWGQHQATQAQLQGNREQIEFQREAMEMARRAQEEENRRRQQEASFRAAKLEDVAGLFQNLQGLQGSMGDVGQGQMRGIAESLLSRQDFGDLERAALHGLERNQGMLDAGLASRGLFSSGVANQQHRGLATDTMMGLARDIASQRNANLGTAANLFGQAGQFDFMNRQLDQNAGQFDMAKLQAIAQLFMDDSFGANAPASGFNNFRTGADMTSTPKARRQVI